MKSRDRQASSTGSDSADATSWPASSASTGSWSNSGIGVWAELASLRSSATAPSNSDLAHLSCSLRSSTTASFPRHRISAFQILIRMSFVDLASASGPEFFGSAPCGNSASS